MARTQQEIFDKMLLDKANEPSLSTLNSTSATAIWRLILWVCAGGIYALELLLDAFKIEINTKVAEAQIGNASWYRNKILAFQFGDNLIFSNGIYAYPTLDDVKKIIKRCAVDEAVDLLVGGVLRVKVAKLDGATLTQLTVTELSALAAYIKKIRFAGTKFQLFSNNGDLLKIAYQIYFDPIIPQATIKANVEIVIKNYISNLPFNGELMVSKLTDELQKIEGVIDVVFLNAASKYAVGDGYGPFTRVKIAVGGYFQISTQAGETLNDLIQYIEQ
jgi:hypothetical protein